MLLPDHNYVMTDSLKECLELLGEKRDQAMVVAGGTDVIFNMRLKLFNPEVAVSIRKVEELQHVEELDDGGLRIGAGARLADLAEHAAINERYPAFAESIREVASTHIRNMATLGGNICLQTRCAYTNNSEEWRKGLNTCYKTEGKICHVIQTSSKCLAINNADTPLALIMLGATMTLQTANGSREVPIAEFYTEDGMDNTVLQPDELVTHVTIPPVSDRTTFLKLAPRKGMDFATVAVAARCDGSGTDVNKVTIVLGSISTNPIVLEKPAQIVSEKGLGDEAIEEALKHIRDELGHLTNLFSRTSYKRQMAGVMVRRALIALRETSKGES
jgi:4-hydroxybenzoyl-CoA reductase subunit beta